MTRRPISAGGAMSLQPTAELATQAEPLDRHATPLQVEASRGACAASKRDSAGLAQPRLSPARNCAPSGACCEIVDDELSNSSDCYAISAVGCRHIARSAGSTACVFMSFCPVSSYVPLSFCLKKPEKTPGPVHTAPGADQCSLYANMLD